MKLTKNISRRDVLRLSGTAAGLSFAEAHAVGPQGAAQRPAGSGGSRLPREVWTASLCTMDLEAADPAGMVELVLGTAGQVAAFHPDILCLPETFAYSGLSGGLPSVAELAERPPGQVTAALARLAKEMNCYVICPLYTRDSGRLYNAAVLLDRGGNVAGEYRKIHPTLGEMESGIAPGPVQPPVFETDFGVIGIQICFDINWPEGWRRLKEAGAEIVFWPSAFAGGNRVNTMAWLNRYVVVSSTLKDTSKICDISGEVLAATGRWNPRWACAAVNLEKAFLHTWPFVRRFEEIKRKYGRKIRIRSWHEEEISVIESRSPDLRVEEVMEEFELVDYDGWIGMAEREQERRRML